LRIRRGAAVCRLSRCSRRASRSLSQTPAGTNAQQQTDDRVIVAAAQQIVYNAKNNTLYQLDTATAAVNALEPGSNDLKARIPVGGEPIRLTLNEVANTILVLDAAQKRVTEIDATSNTVISATTVDVSGTLTGINIDGGGKILVTSVSTPAASAAPVGSISVLDSTTKQLETVREIEVAPRMVVVDPLGNQAVLVSSATTKLVDSSYKVVATLPGGVAAAFSRRGDGVAILSVAGADTTINFAGAFAPAPLILKGSPRAITPLKEGGYLVLLQIDGQGRVVKVSPDGRAEGSVSIAVAGGDLLYDEATSFFTVQNGGTVASAQVPGSASAAASSTASPLVTATASTASSATAAPSASPVPSPSPSAPAVVAASKLLDNAHPVDSGGLYSLSLPKDIKPHLMAASGSRIWFLDQSNGINSLDMNTGQLLAIAQIRSGSRGGFWVAGQSFVYFVDPATGEVHVVNTAKDKVDTYATNVLSSVSAVAVGPDDRLWIGLRNTSYLLAFDPRTHGMDSFDLAGGIVSSLTVDALGRVLYADDARGTVATLDPLTARLSEVAFGPRGPTTALRVDAAGALWIGTSNGEIYKVLGGKSSLALKLQTPVTFLGLDQAGTAWYLAPLPGIPGFAYGPVDGSGGARSFPGPASGLAFSLGGDTFSVDPRGAVWIRSGAVR
jgi:hypothetical protein